MRKKEETSRKDTCLAHAHPEEMVFVLLGRDPAAPMAIYHWCAERIALGKNKEGDEQIVDARACADTMLKEGRKWVGAATHYPEGMGEESRRLHCEFNRLVREQEAGAKNGAEVRKLTDECYAKGIVLVPNGENL
jgi:hypothetical protein